MNWVEQLSFIKDKANTLRRYNTIDVKFTKGHELELYVAVDKSDRAYGLAHFELAEIDTAGMLFYFGAPTYSPFTMKDMKFDLDVAWFDETGKLIQHGTFKAGDKQPLVCFKAFSYVLEVPAGTLPLSDLVVAS